MIEYRTQLPGLTVADWNCRSILWSSHSARRWSRLRRSLLEQLLLFHQLSTWEDPCPFLYNATLFYNGQAKTRDQRYFLRGTFGIVPDY